MTYRTSSFLDVLQQWCLYTVDGMGAWLVSRQVPLVNKLKATFFTFGYDLGKISV